MLSHENTRGREQSFLWTRPTTRDGFPQEKNILTAPWRPHKVPVNHPINYQAQLCLLNRLTDFSLSVWNQYATWVACILLCAFSLSVWNEYTTWMACILLFAESLLKCRAPDTLQSSGALENFCGVVWLVKQGKKPANRNVCYFSYET